MSLEWWDVNVRLRGKAELKGKNILKMNFSAGVSMYNANVTSY
jgi:hypothetical protein